MPTLLAVDDSAEILALRSAMFRLAGFTVIACDTPRKALVCLQRSGIDVIVTDYDMPGLNGLCMAKQARANGYGGPIVMSTAADTVNQPGIYWVNCVVTKGQAPHILLNTVRAYLLGLDSRRTLGAIPCDA